MLMHDREDDDEGQPAHVRDVHCGQARPFRERTHAAKSTGRTNDYARETAVPGVTSGYAFRRAARAQGRLPPYLTAPQWMPENRTNPARIKSRERK
jgi:hypothetical protein